MPDTLSTNNIYIKGRLKSVTQKQFGLFVIHFSDDGNLIANQSIISSYSELYNNNPENSWDQIEDIIMKQKWSGNYNTNLTSTIQSQFGKLEEDTFLRTQLFEAINEYDFNGAETVLYDILNRILQDKKLVIEIGIQEVTDEEIQQVILRRDKENKQKYNKNISSKSSFNVEKGAVLVEISPILSPVKGKPLYDLRIGDKIMTKIEPKTDQANYFIDYYKLRTETRIKPIPGEVVDIKADSKDAPVEIILKIDQGFYGKCTEEERQVKLRLYDPRLDGHMRTERAQENKETDPYSRTSTASDIEGPPMSTILLIGFAGIILILIIILLYFLI